MTLLPLVSGWPQVTAAMVPDTVVLQRVVTGPGWLGTVTSVAIVIIALLLLALAAVLLAVSLRMLREVRRFTDRANRFLDRIGGDLEPVVRHAKTVAENVDYITASLRSDVHRVGRTVHLATDRVNEALAASERRFKELGALLQLAQDEMEDAIVSTAATLRGVRAGAAAFREDAEALLEPDDELEELEEVDDDEYDDTRRGGGHAHPRIRRRSTLRGRG